MKIQIVNDETMKILLEKKLYQFNKKMSCQPLPSQFNDF